MANRLKNWTARAAIGLLAVGSSVACSVINPPAPLPGETEGSAVVAVPGDSDATGQVVPTAAPPRTTGRPTVPVKRDTITETLTLEGKVTAQDQVPISFPGRTSVKDVLVKPGQTVKQGDVLLELETTNGAWAADVRSNLNLARARMEAAEARVAEAHALAQARQEQAARQAVADQRAQQQAIADAEAGLRRAQENLARVRAGASIFERQSAADAVETAQVALQKAVEAQEKLMSGPDPNAIRVAQRDVSNAQVALARTQAELEALTRGPDPAAVRDAEAQVQRAQTQLQLAEATRPDPRIDPAVARSQRELAIQEAQLAVQNAQDALTRVKQPPAELTIQAARQRVQDAQDVLAAARDNLAVLQSDPDEAALEAAQAAVERAQIVVDAAQARLTEINSHPTPLELAGAQDEVRKAQAAVDTARNAPVTAYDASGAPEVEAAEQALIAVQAEVAKMEEAIEDTKLTAPFDGTVVAVRTKHDGLVSPTTVLVVLARPGPPIVQVDVEEEELALLKAGQSAAVQFESGRLAAAPLDAKVATVPLPSRGSAKLPTVDFQVAWPEGPAPAMGTPVQVTVTVQEKTDALVVPKNAVRQVGDKATVEIQDGTRRRSVNVTLGITNDQAAEIVSGLSEGQLVVAGAFS